MPAPYGLAVTLRHGAPERYGTVARQRVQEAHRRTAFDAIDQHPGELVDLRVSECVEAAQRPSGRRARYPRAEVYGSVSTVLYKSLPQRQTGEISLRYPPSQIHPEGGSLMGQVLKQVVGTNGVRRGIRGGIWLGLAGLVILALASAGGTVLSPTSAFARGWFGHRHHGQHDPARAREHAEFAAGWVLRSVNASEEQREQVKTIVGRTLDGLFALREQHDANRAAMLTALSQPTIDRSELERIRKAAIALANTASAQIVTAVADIGDVLTPAQRDELLEAMHRFHD
jgi:protein CpxP